MFYVQDNAKAMPFKPDNFFAFIRYLKTVIYKTGDFGFRVFFPTAG